MPDLSVTIVLPSGGARLADVPDDISTSDLLTELTTLLQLPSVGPDGRPRAEGRRNAGISGGSKR
jgi:hypothetical protein